MKKTASLTPIRYAVRCPHCHTLYYHSRELLETRTVLDCYSCRRDYRIPDIKLFKVEAGQDLNRGLGLINEELRTRRLTKPERLLMINFCNKIVSNMEASALTEDSAQAQPGAESRGHPAE